MPISPAKSDSVQNKLIEKICSMTEYDFTINVLMPLFKNMGWSHVGYHGGPYEGGKDIIFYKYNDFDQIEFHCVQVKKFKPTARAEDSNNIGLILNQLEQAREKYIPYLDGKKYLPNYIYFITPYPIDVRSLESRFDGLINSRNNRIIVIDGVKIADMLRKRMKDLVDQLLEVSTKMQISMVQSINNKELMNALGVKRDVDVASYYCNIDFGLGSISTNTLLSLSFKPIKNDIAISYNNWETYKEVSRITEEHLKISAFNKSSKEIEDEFKYINKINSESRRRIEIKTLTRNETEEYIKQCRNKLDKYIDWLKNRLFLKEVKFEENDLNSFIDCYKYFYDDTNVDNNREYQNKLKQFKHVINSIEKINGFDYEYSMLNDHIEELVEISNVIRREIEQINNKIKKIEVYVTPQSKLIEQAIIKNQFILQRLIEKFNIDVSKDELKCFITDCNNILIRTEPLLNNDLIQHFLGIDSANKYRLGDQIRRFKISIHDVIDSGLNLLLLGEAGAGKTTTLQMYLADKAEKDNSKNVIFCPINHALRLLKNYPIESGTTLNKERLCLSIKLFLDTLEIDISLPDLKELFLSGNVILLLDGIDESIYSFPELPKVINDFVNLYKDCQTIISSRMSGRYVKEFNCLSLTLLPFDDQQRDEFIRSWFKKSNNNKCNELIEHITNNPDLDNIIRLPLLTTIFCILAENDIRLPTNEIILYDERFNLLLGLYDTQKKTERVKSIRVNLEMICRRLAYLFHDHGVRSYRVDKIKSLLSDNLYNVITTNQINIGIDELIDPCNILVPMTSDGEFGFGHLRYQEYLCAKELIHNRNVNIVRLLNIEWWNEPLNLFSRMTDSLEFLFNDIAQYGNFTKYRDKLIKMLSYRPYHEKTRLQDLMNRFGSVDKLDHIVEGSKIGNLSTFDEYF